MNRQPVQARRGFSLVEVSVFMAVGLLMTGAAWSMLQSSLKKGKSTDFKLQGVQANLLLFRTLERDLRYFYEDVFHPVRAIKDVAAKKFTLSFYRFSPDAGTDPGTAWGPVPVQKIEYVFDSSLKKISRAVEGGPARFLFGHFENFGVRSTEVTLPSNATATPMGPAYQVFAVSTPAELLRKALDDRDQEDQRIRTTVVSAFPRRLEGARRDYGYWNAVPFRAPPP